MCLVAFGAFFSIEGRGASWIHFGDCQLEVDPAAVGFANGVNVCASAKMSLEAAFALGEPREHVWVQAGRGRLSAHWRDWLSLVVKGQARKVDLFDPEAPAPVIEKWSDTLAVQVGNPASTPLRFVAGRLRLPTGIDDSWSMEIFQSMESRSTRLSPPIGAVLTLDNLVSSSLDVGYAQVMDDSDSDYSMTGKSAWSARLMHDIAPLDGTRLIATGYSGNAGQRRFGLAVYNANPKGDETQFEWLRHLSTPDGREDDFSQIIRLGWRSAWRSNNRVIFQYDDERFIHRLGVAGFDFKFQEWALIRMSLAYRKSEIESQKSRWFIASGIEVRL